VPSASQGTVVGHANGLNGVYAKGQYWWPVDYNGVIGWTAGNPVGNLPPVGYLPFIGQFSVGAPVTTTLSNPFFTPNRSGDPANSGR
jgi:hypothetical protein